MPAPQQGPSEHGATPTPWFTSAFVFAAALFLLVLVGVMAYRSTVELNEMSERARASYVTVIQLDDVLASITEAETGQRGYLLTGRDQYLDPYRRALVNIEGRLQALERTLGSDPAQEADLTELRPLIQKRLEELANILAITENEGRLAGERTMSSDQGQKFMRAIRSLGASIRQREEDAVNRRSAAADASASRTRALVGAGSALSILLFAGAAWIALRHMRQLRLAEVAIRLSEERLDAVVDHSPAVIALRDKATSRYLLVNREWERLYGLPRSEVIGRTPRDILAAPLADAIEEDDARVFAEGAARQFEEVVPSAEGDRVFVSARFPLVHEQLGSIYALGRVSTDITERKAMEEALRRAGDELEARVEERTAELAAANEELSLTAAKLERSNRELQDFAYVASHDLQEPLRKIRTFADRLRSKWGASLSEDAVDYLQRMVRSAERMQRLINDLLALSRVTTQGQPFVVVDLAQLAREVVSDLEVRIEQTGATVEVGDLPSIEADPTQMRQLLQNLIGNALKFQRADRTPRVRVTALVDPSGDHCELRVEDNGIGFDVKYVDRIFNPFQRLHGRDEYEGTGMGLAICRKITERHRGTITARSAPGEGAVFIVRLPRRREVEAA